MSLNERVEVQFVKFYGLYKASIVTSYTNKTEQYLHTYTY